MKYTFDQYKLHHFGGSSEKMMAYWGKLPQAATRWKDDFFYVVGPEHLRVPAKNIITFEEGVK
jgi:hypothetical protein